MLSRRALLTLPLAAACGSRPQAGYRGYAFVANQEGQALAAVDLQAMAVVRHIPLDASPAQVVAPRTRPSVYALTPATGTVHEVQSDHLTFKRKLAAGSQALSMQLDPQERAMYVLTREPRALVRVSLEAFKVEARIALPEDLTDFAISPDGTTVALSGPTVRFLDLKSQRLGPPLSSGDFGAVRFLSDSRTLIVADRAARMLSLYEVPSGRLITHLPIAVRPDHLCFNRDGGQLFVTGAGLDGVVVVYPFHTPEVAQTLLAGRAPQAMDASGSFLFVASPELGAVTILKINTYEVIAVVSVGNDPGFIKVTPDDQFALILNRKSGDVAVLDLFRYTRRNTRRLLLTVIPVGSEPVSADVKAI